MREHTLLSLSELSQELTVSLDLFSLADLVLFNLMGQLGTSRAAMWLAPEQGGVPILVRSHGIGRQIAKALGPVCTAQLVEALAREAGPLPAEMLGDAVGTAAAHLIQRAEIAVFAVIRARGESLGLVALGPRIGGAPYGTVELQALHAALSMVAVAIQNMSFTHRLRENNRRLRLANAELEDLDRLKSEFLSNVNHELRTPLTCIIAYVDTLIDSHHRPQQIDDFLKVVMQEAVKLQGLLENLLALSAASENRLTLNVATGDLATTISRYYEDRMPGVSHGLRELIFQCQPGLPPARFDEKRILQVIDALIDNAVKFTPEGARIELRVGTVLEDGSSWVRIDVGDDGPGVPAERLPTLFESFRQVDGSSTRSVGGMGIGLAMARRLATAMGGRLTAQSELGKGSVFSVYLPVD